MKKYDNNGKTNNKTDYCLYELFPLEYDKRIQCYLERSVPNSGNLDKLSSYISLFQYVLKRNILARGKNIAPLLRRKC